MAIAFIISFLLWGIRSNTDWSADRIAGADARRLKCSCAMRPEGSGLRIGSFVALGFSLIGIGWLYSRQLAGTSDSGILAENHDRPLTGTVRELFIMSAPDLSPLPSAVSARSSPSVHSARSATIC